MTTLLIDSPTALLLPPVISEENQVSDWFPLPAPDPITDYITASFLDEEVASDSWQVARLSRSAYLYREVESGWQIVVKFHAAKTGKDAIRHAEREHRLTLRIWESLESN